MELVSYKHALGCFMMLYNCVRSGARDIEAHF